MKKFIVFAAALLCLSSCSETLEPVSFNVTTDAAEVCRAGDKIVFRFSGNPDYITFYSDEAGHRYDLAGQLDDEGTANYGVSVKSMNARLDTYTYVYETAGEYEAVFVARNATYEGEHQRVVRLKFTIAEQALE